LLLAGTGSLHSTHTIAYVDLIYWWTTCLQWLDVHFLVSPLHAGYSLKDLPCPPHRSISTSSISSSALNLFYALFSNSLYHPRSASLWARHQHPSPLLRLVLHYLPDSLVRSPDWRVACSFTLRLYSSVRACCARQHLLRAYLPSATDPRFGSCFTTVFHCNRYRLPHGLAYPAATPRLRPYGLRNSYFG